MNLPIRKNMRLKDYDYSQNGAYFITICTKNKAHLFGEIVGADLVSARMELSYAGQMIEEMLFETIHSFDDIIADKYVIMPNHFHCIIIISRADTRSAPTRGKVADIIQAFKSKTTLEYIRGVTLGLLPSFDKQVWQRNYYEHIIRDETDYQTKWKYIDENPAKWAEDKYYSGG